VSSTKFDTFVGVLILGNAVVLMIQLQFQGYKSAIVLKLQSDSGDWDNADHWFFVMEHIFNGLFVMELIGRLCVFRCGFFKEFSNVYDFGLVFATSVQMYIMDPLGSGGSGANLTLFRLTRFVRFVRVLRIVRVMKLFGELRVLVATIVHSFKALLWSMILLMMIMIMSGVFLCQLLKDFIQDEDGPYELRHWTFRHYGSSMRAVWTMFEVTLSGGWPMYARRLVEEVSGWYAIFWIFYIWVVVFAIIRIITAIFLKETLQVAASDAEMMVNEQMKAKQHYVKKLSTVFNALDTSGDGRLSEPEFKTIMSHPKVKSWLQILELEVHDAEGLFHLLDDGDGEITYDEFLQGVMRLKGPAKSMDVVAILRASDKMVKKLDHVCNLCIAMSITPPQADHNVKCDKIMDVCLAVQDSHDLLACQIGELADRTHAGAVHRRSAYKF